MRKQDLMYLILETVTLCVLIFEHTVLNLDFALELMCGCAIVTLIHFIKIVLPYAITVTYEEF